MANLLDTVQVAEELGVAVGTVQNWRAQRRGPRFMKAGHRVIYAKAEIDRFRDEYTKSEGRT